ncbi:xylulokinase [Cohaesibacter haloalkalitolerans]|uniref:xylulokinase n=1 Tax=Cohaesibacter haloalkalitolerans TaxID=1162980 RepID=UPI000E64E7B1|nr:FGGY family carbohydrate kinase [Cohaesibacter haloalkalitolerans]
MVTQKNHSIVLGIDIGTTGTKCSFYDLECNLVASEYQEYPMIHPREGWVEEDPNVWWASVVRNVKLCIDRGEVDPARVAGIGVSCTNSFIPLDRQGNNLYNAILQLDQRSASEVQWLEDTIGRDRIYEVTGNRIARGTFALPTLLWYIKNRPDIIEKTHKFVVPSGFIINKLTGEFSINTSRMGFTLLSNIRTGTWDEGLARDTGVPIDKLPKPYNATDIVGHVTAVAAEQCGLREGTPVVAGSMDTVAAAIGAGAILPGDSFLAIGTCGRACFTTETPAFDDRLMNCRHAVDGQWLSVEATNAAGASLRWFRDQFGEALAERCQKEGSSIYEMLDKVAEEASAGSNGVLYLPYLSGERCPIWDPNARGVMFGLSFGTSYGDMVRAIMEGVAYSIRQGMKIVLKHNDKPKSLSLGGGIANSRIWCQIFADILNEPIVRLRVNETETLGAAILAAKGVGLIDSLDEMTGYTTQHCEIIHPDKQASAIYDDYFVLYEKLYEDLKDNFITAQSIKEKHS